ncbi:hypothetical protein [Novosphingobium resinovorum]|uniref:hypothetical protein n=1 Tax=Novosphingobium resinovorum TaxID=158500 RepID=UPI003D2D7711
MALLVVGGAVAGDAAVPVFHAPGLCDGVVRLHLAVGHKIRWRETLPPLLGSSLFSVDHMPCCDIRRPPQINADVEIRAADGLKRIRDRVELALRHPRQQPGTRRGNSPSALPPLWVDAVV